jgi:hypothetical protein
MAFHVAATRTGEAAEFIIGEHPRNAFFRMEGLTVRTPLEW